MFQAFSKNQSLQDVKVNSRILNKFENTGDGFHLWYADQRLWPLQRIEFEGIVTTPVNLSPLETIILDIFQCMADSPPDNKTITDQLCLDDTAFVDEAVSELVRLGALQADSTGRLTVTTLGRECFNRGQLPGKSRKLNLALCFDPVGDAFPQESFFPGSEQDCGNDSGIQPIVSSIRRACVNRIDLDTVRRVAASQGLLSGDDAVVFSADPSDRNREGAIIWRKVYLLVFLNDEGQMYLRVSDPESRTATEWFQNVLDECLKAGNITFTDLLCSMAVPDDTVRGGNGDLASLSRIPAYEVRDTILSAINNAGEYLFIQTCGFGNNGNGHVKGLFEAVKNAANRGVRCHLLWAGSNLNGNIPIHENITNSSIPDIDLEFLIADNNVVLAVLVEQVTWTNGEPAGRVLRVGKSQSSLVHDRLKQRFIKAFQVGEAAAVEPAVALQNENKKKTNSTVTTAAMQKMR